MSPRGNEYFHSQGTPYWGRDFNPGSKNRSGLASHPTASSVTTAARRTIKTLKNGIILQGNANVS